MAKAKDTSLFDTALSPAARKALETSLSGSTEKINTTQSMLQRADISLLSAKDDLLSNIEANVNGVFSRIIPSSSANGDVGNDVIDNLIALANKNTKDTRRRKGANKKLTNEVNKLKSDIVAANHQQLAQMMSNHKKKISDAVATYNMIIKIIPKMRLALNTFANTIISPDDFTKQSISASINSESLDAETVTRVSKRANQLLEEHELNKNIKDDILSYLVNGRLFYLVMPLNKEMAKMLNESVDSEGIETAYTSLDTNYYKELATKSLAETAAGVTPNIALSETLNEIKTLFAIKEDGKLEDACDKIDSFIKNEFLVSDSSAFALDAVSFGYDDTVNLSESFSSGLEKFASSRQIATADTKPNEGEEVTEADIKGKNSAIVRRISPANIIPLEYEGRNYGYIHLDIVEIDPDNHVLPVDNTSEVEGMGMIPTSSHAFSNGSVLQNIVSSSTDININGNNTAKNKNYENPTGGGIDAVEDARLQFMAAAFANKLSRKTNLKLLRRNDALKTAIYNGLAIKKLGSTEKVRIVYLKPEEVVYINRGHSIFDNVLFFAKLYIATLISVLLQNVLRGGEQRMVYVEVGQDNNGAHAVQQVIRDMKSKEISSITNMDLQTVLNIQSQFQDYYIPVVDGEKPITFENLDSLSNKSIDDEFLSWLSNNIFSGIGLPAAYLTEVENIDFAKSLSMQNSRFLRDCIAEQAILSEGYTELLRKIFTISVNSNSEKKSRGKGKIADMSVNDDAVDCDVLSIILPAPAALSLMNISEQMGNASSMLDSLMTGIDLSDVEEADVESIKTAVKARLTRKYVTSVDWDELESIVKKEITEFKEKKIAAAIASNSSEIDSSADDAENSMDTTDETDV